VPRLYPTTRIPAQPASAAWRSGHSVPASESWNARRFSSRSPHPNLSPPRPCTRSDARACRSARRFAAAPASASDVCGPKGRASKPQDTSGCERMPASDRPFPSFEDRGPASRHTRVGPRPGSDSLGEDRRGVSHGSLG